jgi:hypothetical protein
MSTLHDPPASNNGDFCTSRRRRRLNNRRECVSFDFELGGQYFHATVGCFPDGAPAEIFLNAAKFNSAADIAARDAAVAISIGLQYGVPADVLRKMRDARGAPSGPAAYVLDLVAAETEMSL